MHEFKISHWLIESIRENLHAESRVLFPESDLGKSPKPGQKIKLIRQFLNRIADTQGLPCPSAIRKTAKTEYLFEEFQKLKDQVSSIGSITKRWVYKI